MNGKKIFWRDHVFTDLFCVCVSSALITTYLLFYTKRVPYLFQVWIIDYEVLCLIQPSTCKTLGNVDVTSLKRRRRRRKNL